MTGITTAKHRPPEAVAEGGATGAKGAATTIKKVARDVVAAVGVLLAVVTLTFFALKLIPGDPALIILGSSGSAPSEETVQAVRAEYGLDQPLFAQYTSYVTGIFQGELGVSYRHKVPVAEYLLPQVWPTVQITIVSIVLAWAIALALGLLTVRRGRFADALGRGVEVLFASVPPFWLALVLLVFFAFTLGWFPVAGNGGFSSLVLPSLALAIPLAGFLAQVTRESLDEALSQPFALTARARGASEWRVRVVHALRHALLPGITLTGWAVGALISSAVVVEVIFARQGLGRSLVEAIVGRDAPVVLAIVLFIGVVYVVVNRLVDVLYRVVDRRIQFKEG